MVGLLNSSYVCSKGKTERDITTDVNTRMLLFVPLSLSKPQPQPLPPGFKDIARPCRAPCPEAIVEAFLRVVVAFEDLVPRFSQRMYENKCDDRSDGDAGVAKREEQVRPRPEERKEKR